MRSASLVGQIELIGDRLRGVRGDRPDVDVVRQKRADAAPQDAEQQRPAAQQPGPEQLPDQHENCGQQGGRRTEPRQVIEPWAGGPAQQVSRPQIPGIEHDPRQRFRGERGVEQPGALPAGAPHGLVDVRVAGDDHVSGEHAPRRNANRGKRDRRHRKKAEHGGEDRRPPPPGRARLHAGDWFGAPAGERHQAASRPACAARGGIRLAAPRGRTQRKRVITTAT